MNARRSERLVDVALGEPERLVDVALGEPERGAWRRLWVAAVVAVAFYGGLGTWGAVASSSLARWGDAVAAKVHRILSHEDPVAMPPPPKPPAPKPKPPPPPPQPAPPEPVAKAAPPKRAPSKPAPSRAVHHAPARAAKIIAAAPSGPVAMDTVTFATGSATHYAGGSTASNGTSDTAVHGPIDRSPPPPLSPPAPPPPPRGPDRSAPVGLGTTDWSCPWPAAADDADIDEQAVTLRVRVASSGKPLTAQVLTHPGHGFAAAAHKCALQMRYTPARNRKGHVIEALSPPIRVHFIR